MKRIAVLAVFTALLGTSFTAFAAEPCDCKGPECKPKAAQPSAYNPGSRSLSDREFNHTDLSHRW